MATTLANKQSVKHVIYGSLGHDHKLGLLLKTAGSETKVATEVFKRTPFGARYIDISMGGKVLGGVDTRAH